VHFWFKALAEGRDPEEVKSTHWAWADEAAQTAKTDFLEFKFAGDGLVNVPVSRALKKLEMGMLSAPDDPLSWRLTLAPPEVAEISPDGRGWPAVPDIEQFRELRRKLFATLRGEGGQRVVQAVDLFPLRPQVAEYAERYLSLLSQLLHQAELVSADGQNLPSRTSRSCWRWILCLSN
jgi:hypothetical protein